MYDGEQKTYKQPNFKVLGKYVEKSSEVDR
jgi:hypothetical protein